MTLLTLPMAAAVFGGLIAGSLLHELTHAVAVWALGGRVVEWDLWDFALIYEVPADAPLWTERVVNLAPQTLGVVSLSAVAAAGAWPPFTPAGVFAACLWGSLTLLGGVEDFALGVARNPQDWWFRQQPTAVQLGLAGVAGTVVGYAVVYQTSHIQHEALQAAVGRLGAGALVGGTLIAGIGVYLADRPEVAP